MPASPVTALPDPEEQPTVAVEVAAAALGLSRDATYDAAARGDLPVIRVGRRVLVKTAELRRMVGLDSPAA